MASERVAMYPGTFDPITNGHMDVLHRATDLFDRIVVGIAINPSKTPLFSLEERVAMIEDAIHEKGWDRVSVDTLDGLAVEGARKHNAVALIRGLRAVSDFEYEFQMCLMNRHLDPDLHTVYLMPKEEYTYLNSTIVRNVARHGGDVSRFVPNGVKRRLYDKFNIQT
ncbi:pantetheine-phosphate adenylyltransferase [bacterium]|nr:pantetheine-phosphate adenylyltransferase [bacterium]